jgi:tetratricopeptide (TPR) repeat protein
MTESPAGEPTKSPARLPIWLFVAALVVVTAFVFHPALHNQFVNDDDDVNFLNNEHNLGFGWDQIRWMFTAVHIGVYTPISWLTVAFDYSTGGGLNPWRFHLTNLVLHCANVALLLLVFVRLIEWAIGPEGRTSRRGAVLAGAAFAAFFYALHPLRGEVVAWASARNNLVGAFFFLLSVLAYLRGQDGRPDAGRRKWTLLSAGLYLLALLSKSFTIALPLVLLVLDVYPLRRVGSDARGLFTPATWKLFIEKLPHFIVAVIVVAITVFARSELYPPDLRVSWRVAIAAHGIAFYVLNTIYPHGLSPYHPIPLELDPYDAWYVLSGLGVIAVTLACILLRRRYPVLLAAWVAFGLLVAPLLGLVATGAYVAAERYSYLSTMSFALVPGACVVALWRRGAGARGAVVVVGVGLMTWCSFGTRDVIAFWKDSVRLWSRVLEVYPDEHLAQLQLGNAHGDAGDVTNALKWYEIAADDHPRTKFPMKRTLRHRSMAVNNIAKLLVQEGRFDEAIERYREAVTLDPDRKIAMEALAALLFRLDRPDEALSWARRGLDVSRTVTWELPTAAEFAQTVQRIETWMDRRRQAEQAIQERRYQEAADIYQQEIRDQPHNIAAHRELATLLVQSRQHALAHKILKQGLVEWPYDRGARFLRAWLESSSHDPAVRDGASAVAIAEGLLKEGDPDDASALEVLAAGHAETGRFDEALKAVGRALRTAPEERRPVLEEMQTRYRQAAAATPAPPQERPAGGRTGDD